MNCSIYILKVICLNLKIQALLNIEMKKNNILIAGDPNSINSEIIYKSWKKINISLKKNIYFIANYNLLKRQFKILKYKIKLQKNENELDKIESAKSKNYRYKTKF